MFPAGWQPPKLTGRSSTFLSGGVVLLIIVVMVVSAVLEKNGEMASDLIPGAPMPDYTAVSVDGAEVALGEFRGNAILLNFWATWCSSCVDQFPGMQLLNAEFDGQGLTIISVNLDEADRDGVQELWDRWEYGWLNLFDDPDRVQELFGWDDRYPKTVLVNRDGTVGVWWQGRLDPSLPENRTLIEEAIQGS
jgi:thiol-disulfide isomerase/thioredoxin